MGITRYYKIKKPDKNQEKIIKNLLNYNIFVNAVAGSGKTNTILNIIKKYNNKKILILCSDEKSNLEILNKANFLKFKNIEIHTFITFINTLLQIKCKNDNDLKQIDNIKFQNIQTLNYDIVALENAENLNSIYYEIICKTLKNNKKDFKMCVFGDKNQTNFFSKKAEPRYFEFADKLFEFNKYKWKKFFLSETYRFNQNICNFINKTFFQIQLLNSNIKNKDQVEYLIINPWNSKILLNKIMKSIKTYGLNEILILSSSKIKLNTPIFEIINFLNEKKIPLYFHDDNTKWNINNTKDRICFASFNQAKGYEKKVVFVFEFDDSYILKNKKNNEKIDKYKNILYISMTRAKNKLFLIHNYQYKKISFLEKVNINKIALVSIDKKNDKIYKIRNNEDNKSLSKNINKNLNQNINNKNYSSNNIYLIDNLISHLPSHILNYARECFKIRSNVLSNEYEKFDSLNNKLYRFNNDKLNYLSLSNLIESSIQINFQKNFQKNEKNTPLNILINKFKNNEEEIKKTKNKLLKYKKFLFELKNKNNWTIDDLLLLSNLWMYYLKNQSIIFKPNLKILNKVHYENINDSLKEYLSDKINFGMTFEKNTFKEFENKKIFCIIDAIDYLNNCIWNFKFKDEIKEIDFINLALQAFILNNNISAITKIMNQIINKKIPSKNLKYDKNLNNINFEYLIFNVKTNNIYQIIPLFDKLELLVKKIFEFNFKENIYEKNRLFLEENIKLKNLHTKTWL